MVQWWWWRWVVTRREVAEREGGCRSEGGCCGRGYPSARPGEEFLDGGPGLFLLLLLLLHLPLHFLFSHWGLLNPRRKARFPSETEREGGEGGGERAGRRRANRRTMEREGGVKETGDAESEGTDESEGVVGGEMGGITERIVFPELTRERAEV